MRKESQFYKSKVVKLYEKVIILLESSGKILRKKSLYTYKNNVK